MKFSLARGALVLAASLTLASCGGGKATFPINVTVYGVVYPGLVLSTGGQDLAISPPATAGAEVTAVFPNQISYGDSYDVIPKGQVLDSTGATTAVGAQPKHQTCSVYSTQFPAKATAGQFASIDVRYACVINGFNVGGSITNLTGDGLVLTNGSTAGATAAPAKGSTSYVLSLKSAYGSTYGVTVLTQPTGQTCTVTNNVGTIDDAVETAGSVSNVNVNCVNNS
ncbi:hypothetical protein HH212_10275 [Massilia forsythiae]|uniref:Lipoprotein n=1 Tax=Massilia forsythiae TaxID=2728020 RepID=A0A7Z2VWC5_9BURK|nr:hypothetical protein [Massilia forsythiae]QJE00360.1 hypothetical protein HH212_10275 [Massilia forsythiae]